MTERREDGGRAGLKPGPAPTILLATTNPGKVREIRDFLKGLPFTVAGLDDVLPGLSYRERGRTFSENARGKSLYYAGRSGLPALAEDSGLEVEALDGAPGVRSARFAGAGATDEENNRKLLRLLEKIPWQERTARFVCVMVLSRRGKVLAEIRGEARGFIREGPRGANGFGYDPLFYYPRLRRTFAELSPEVKNSVSHRGRALRGLRRFLESHPGLD